MEGLSGKRILFVVTKSNWGGAQVYVYKLACRFKEAGAIVSVALGGTGLPGSDTGLLAARLTEAGIPFHVIPSFVREISFKEELGAFRGLRELIRRERLDVLHLNSGKAGLLGALAGRLERIPRIVFTAHGWAHRESRSIVWRMVVWKGAWFTVLLCHAVIVLSELDRKAAPALLRKRKIHIVRNGAAVGSLHTREEARRFLAPTIPELERLPKWVLMTAELTRNKGVDLAIRAFAGVSTNLDDTALVVVGEGEDHAELTKLIADYRLQKRAFLLGFVPDAAKYLVAGNVFVLPSRKEGLPFVLLEAGLASLPVIASRVGGVPEIVDHEKSGLLIRTGDVDGLADSMTRLLTNPDEAHALGEELNKVVRERFSEEDMLSGTASIYLKK
ncbi:MAG TPA: glycosyltransferase [Candidatus Paceibacterota bacterium]|jgi:glycosyltransferase involved in cell wall biosynthesis